MTNDELRALADCLDDPNAMQRTARRKAADYLRAQADAQPVAWRSKIEGKTKDYWIIQQSEWLAREQPAWEPLYTAPVAPHHAMLDSHRRLVEQAIQTAEHPSGMSTHDGKARIDASVLRRMLAIIDSLPAAPQAEPKREPVGTLTIRDDMGAEITFHRSFTMRPRQTFAIYPNWDLLTHDIPTRGAFVVNAPKEIGNE